MRQFILSLYIVLPFLLSAQSFSIEELWQQLNDSDAFKKEALRVSIQKNETIRDRLDRLPLIYGDLNLQRNLIIPTTPVPAVAFDPSAPEGTYIPLRFATQWSSKAGAQVEWRLFDPVRKAKASETKILVEKAEIEQKKMQQSWKKEATLAYTAIVLATAQYQTALEDSTVYQKILQISKDRYEAGRETYANYLDAQQQMRRRKIQLAEAWAVLVAANLELGKYADLSPFTILSSNLEQITGLLRSYESAYYEADLAQLDIRLNTLDREDVNRQLLPTVSFNAYLGSQYFNNELHLFDGQSWYGNSYANVAIRIPISAYFLSRTSRRQIAMEGELRQLDWDGKRRDENILRKKRNENVQAAERKVEELKTIVALSQEKKEVLWDAFQSGRTLLTEYNATNSEYLKTQQEFWQAQYDLISILIE